LHTHAVDWHVASCEHVGIQPTDPVELLAAAVLTAVLAATVLAAVELLAASDELLTA
jgi:hypothetical protein